MISIRQVIVTTVTLVGIVLANGVAAQSGLGVISRQAAVVSKNFDIADKNQDGFLTKAEADAGYTPYLADHFSAIDTRHAGKISKQDVADYWKSNIRKSNERSKHPAPSKAGS